jgi:hypothetical protein
MVARIDRVLREELDLPDGLADPNVYILDPCCGTGSYLIEVLDRIAATLRTKRAAALAAQEIKRAAMQRVFGFEILPAPFVVAHLQIGLLLQSLGAPLSDRKKERAAIYLTNALTGWELPDGSKPQMLLAFPELLQERDAAERVKQATPILVILGNPPYNGFAGARPFRRARIPSAGCTHARCLPEQYRVLEKYPSRVWEYTIGGYQVIKKWLSYREREILGRGLTTDEVHAVTAIARRIAAIILLEPKLDANHDAITASTYRWPSSEKVQSGPPRLRGER